MVLECFRDAVQSSEKVLLNWHQGQEPPFLEYQAKIGFFRHKMRGMTRHILELLQKELINTLTALLFKSVKTQVLGAV